MFILSPLVMIAIQPYLWHQPGVRILEFLFEGLSCAFRPETNYPFFFFGNSYITNQLPWHYPFFVIGVTSPDAVLSLALFGVACISCLREQRPVIMLLLLKALFISVMGLLPGAVLYDGVRQLLSSLRFSPRLREWASMFLSRGRQKPPRGRRLTALPSSRDVKS